MLEQEHEINFLHGFLRIDIIEARDLPDTDSTFFNISRGDWTDPFVTVWLDQTELAKTAFLQNNLNPVWEESFNIPVCHHANTIKFSVMDREHIGAETVGHVLLSTDEVMSGEHLEGWFDLVVSNSGETQGGVHIALQLFPMETLSVGKVLGESYFQPREGCFLEMYQDADTPMLPVFEGVSDPLGEQYVPSRLWRDLYNYLNNSTKLIYITGWSVFTDISLIRHEDEEGFGETVGELLKRKAEEGVRVLVMTWNEKSNDTGLMAGLLGTHDETTYTYFKGTDVVCINVPREKKSWMGLGSQFVGTLYTHHQKTVVCDAELEDGSGRRRLIGFVGGIDITDGRFDTPSFPLFRTLFTKHSGDFYQNCTVGCKAETGPRQPWHDIHARLEGPVVIDIMENFTNRWIKQKYDMMDAILDLEDDEEVVLDAPAVERENSGGEFVVQLFRSITSDSAILDEERESVLHSKYGRRVDDSIMRQYVNLIRAAQEFIYIENQYFLGSAYSWTADRKTLSNHIIPMELTQKIINKMEAGESFHVYVCIPMYPEGDPASVPSQEIIRWQFRTMESMYKRIALAIERLGTDTRPSDHLSFYCLGTREGVDETDWDELGAPDPATGAEIVRETLRHPIYVHSKLMVVDDDYVVIGSANINQRSMAGERDTEIAIGAFQPSHSAGDGPPRGDIHSFRVALWSAHLGGYHPALEDPNSAECLDYIRQVTEDFWALYTADEPESSPVHLLPYPLYIAQTGDLSPKEAPWDCYPDTIAPVVGTKSGMLPAKLTT